MTPFEKFFTDEWQRRLEAVEIPGMPHASWDRKAAWLLWCELHPDLKARAAVEGRAPKRTADLDDLL